MAGSKKKGSNKKNNYSSRAKKAFGGGSMETDTSEAKRVPSDGGFGDGSITIDPEMILDEEFALEETSPLYSEVVRASISSSNKEEVHPPITVPSTVQVERPLVIGAPSVPPPVKNQVEIIPAKQVNMPVFGNAPRLPVKRAAPVAARQVPGVRRDAEGHLLGYTSWAFGNVQRFQTIIEYQTATQLVRYGCDTNESIAKIDAEIAAFNAQNPRIQLDLNGRVVNPLGDKTELPQGRQVPVLMPNAPAPLLLVPEQGTVLDGM